VKAILIRAIHGLIPGDSDSVEWYKKIKLGSAVRVTATTVRNYAFLKKYFALLNVAYDNWEPGEVSSKHGVPEKNFEQFREDLTILCGYFKVVQRVDGSTRIKGKSISFAKMESEEFEKLYNTTLDVLLRRVYKSEISKEELENIVNQYMSFA